MILLFLMLMPRSLVQVGYVALLLRRDRHRQEFLVDHDEPVSRGGRHDLTNLVVLDKRCNEIKGMMNGRELGSLLKTVESFHEQARRNLLARLRAGAKFIRN